MMWQFLGLLLVHWFADFVLQTHWQATNKSKRNDALALHVLTYTAVLAVWTVVAFGGFGAKWPALAGFIMINSVLHFATDYCTSRWSSRLYAKQDWHNFFVVIGLDQLIHQFTLAATMLWIFQI